jgi:hypothetical protein
MFYIWHTIPDYDHKYDDMLIRLRKRIPFIKDKYNFICDLTKYYNWCEENNLFLCHSILIYGREDLTISNALVGFGFTDDVDAMAFRLRFL